MSLWLLTRIDPGPHYDRYIEFVVRANSEGAARSEACHLVLDSLREYLGDDLDEADFDNGRMWLEEKVVQAVRIDPDGDQGIIASNFRHG